MTRCANGHYYEDSVFDECPYCSSSSNCENTIVDFSNDNDSTLPLYPSHYDMYSSEDDVGNATIGFKGAEDEKTLGIFSELMKMEPITGWLVCTAGPEKGRDYRLHTGRNFIGRSMSMDVIIAEDQSIKRDKHAIISYDPVESRFELVQGESSDLVHNGAVVISSVRLKDGDMIEMGSSKFCFIAYCNEERKWK